MPLRMEPRSPPDAAAYDKLPTLVLQGGGALGSYQAGVYQALAEARILPDWVAGTSIGAINAAIIAGNEPRHRLDRLSEFWETVTASSMGWPEWPDTLFGDAHSQAGAVPALLFGQPGFFEHWTPASWVLSGFSPSLYDTAPLLPTLERLVDFDRINGGKTRVSVGAVNVRTGSMVYFDSREMRIRPQHILASAALPPGFPAVEIDGQFYWDGGLYSNTPLEHVLSYYPRRSRLVFQVDLFPACGCLPRTLDEVIERTSDIRYSSRTRMVTDELRTLHDIRHNLNLLLESLPEALKNQPAARALGEIACVTTMDIAQIIYRPDEPQGATKDFAFSRRTMRRRWQRGVFDARHTIEAAPWLAPQDPEIGVRIFDVIGRARHAPATAAQAALRPA
ncbi:MAG: patatin-like phospholipase family protein [Acetobacteraceae bacterium]